MLVSLPGGGKLVPHLGQKLGVCLLQNLRQRQRKSLKKRDMIPAWGQLRRSCLEDRVRQVGLALSMGLRGQCRNKQTIQSTQGLQHLVIQTAEYCSKNLILLTGADFLMHTHIVFITTVGLRLHSMIVAPNIQQEPVASASEILNENVLSCVEVLNMWNHCRAIMQVATMK